MLDEIGASELPVELVLNKVDAVDALAAAPAREPLPGRAPDLGARPGRGSTSCARGSPSASPTGSSSCELLVPYSEGGELAELYALGPPIESRSDRADGVLIRARLPARDVRRFARFLVADASGRSGDAGGVIEIPVTRLRDDAVLPARAYPGDAGLDLVACERHEIGPGERALVGHGHRRRDPGGPRGARHAALRARARSTASRSSTRPGWSTPATGASCA